MKQAAYIILLFFLLALPAGAARAVTIEINKGEMIKLDRPISSVVLADPEVADVQVVSPKLIFVHGKKIGETNLVAVDNTDETVFSSVVEVTHNLSKLEQTIRNISPDADISFRTVDGGLVMEGYAPSTADSDSINTVASAFLGANDRMVNMVKTAGSDQVTLQVKVVEMTRNDVKRLGINMQNMFDIRGLSLQVLQGPDIEIDTDGLLNGTLYEQDHLGILDRSGSTGTQILGRWGRNGRMSNLIDAMETQGLVHVLAEPSLTTTSGKSASFLAGGEFPIATRSNDGSVTVEYKNFGVGLNFTPVVLSRDRISVDVAPEVSTISFDNPIEVAGIRNPIILTRKAQATVELGSGQTFALAGLLKSDNSNSIDKFPGLGDVPVLGGLFRSQQFQNNQTELVILVTPYIVRPIAEQNAVQTPLDGYVPPTDLQRLLYGNLYQQEPMGEEKREGLHLLPQLHGEGGFITETE